MNHYAWKATNGKSGDVYAFDEEEAKIKVETLFDVEVEDMELLEENADVNRFTGKRFDNNENAARSILKKGDKLKRFSDGKVFTYVGPDDSDDENYGHVEEMLVPVYLPDFEKEEE